MAILRRAKTPEAPAGGGQDAGYGFYSLGLRIGAPGAHDVGVLSGDRAQAPVVVWAYWVAVQPEVGRVRRAQGVQIDDGDPVAAPGRGEVAAAPDRWIVERGIGGARIEH